MKRPNIQGCFKVAAKPPGMRKFSGFLPKAATTLERPCQYCCPTLFSRHASAALLK
jgi:hypothetical protein